MESTPHKARKTNSSQNKGKDEAQFSQNQPQFNPQHSPQFQHFSQSQSQFSTFYQFSQPVPTQHSNNEFRPSQDLQELFKIVSEFSNFYKEDLEDKKRVRAEKLRLKKKKQQSEILQNQEAVRMMQEQQKDKDMDFFLKPHDHLDGAALNAVLARKREIAQRWGWE
ncbi:hypothetical protein HanIR_Chr14g0703481 [Helianthus annuus]|nr:hypothetical protein HanIR_Chr14g0703481 [Helianthus annuus]